jgi:hypothetical protein
MRFDRLIILMCLVGVWGCKTTQTSTASTSIYEEDLRLLRPNLEPKNEPAEIKVQEAVIPSGHLKTELDTISNIITRENLKPRTEKGYTIQIYSGSSREEATKALGRVRIAFPEVESEISYFQPDFKVKTGKFISRLNAYETYEKVKLQFADALLIPENIKINHE